ncbi:MAG: AraC family transcriptional regulator [Gorillibacterium sp.]|nr:AraC family transcriptional regulator [Gorillibacterium sp.]
MLTPGELAAKLNRLVLSILLVGHIHVEPEWRQGPLLLKYHSLWIIQKGKGLFTIDGIRYPAEPGKVFFFAPHMKVERTTDPNDLLEYSFLRFHYTEVYEEKEQWIIPENRTSPFPLSGMYTVHNAPRLIDLFEQIYQLWQQHGHITAMRRNLLLQELLLFLILDFRAQKSAGDATVAIELTQDYMVTHYRQSLSVENLARMAGLSPSHYTRLFRKTIGYSPIDYLTHLRVDRAKEMLALSDYRLKPIAESVGYADEFYFSRVFKKIEGVSPRDYAKKHRIKGSP